MPAVSDRLLITEEGKMFPEKLNLFGVSVATSIVTIFVVASFPKYFFYVPFANGVDALSFFSFTSMVGWIALVVAPPLFLWKPKVWGTPKAVFFILLTLFYTLSTLGVKAASLALYGKIWADYLVVYPVLALIEWGFPIFYILVSIRLSSNARSANRPNAHSYEARSMYQPTGPSNGGFN
jgi:hypothetical protein